MIGHVLILGVRVDILTSETALQYLLERLNQGEKTAIATVNTEFVIEAQRNREFSMQLNDSNLATADGIGILWAARLVEYSPRLNRKVAHALEIVVVALYLGISTVVSRSARYRVIPEQITGVDFSLKLAELACNHKFRLFLLGERPGVAKEAGNKLKHLFSDLSIAGTYAGDGGISGDNEVNQVLHRHPAEILLVAYGAPKQELWIKRNLALAPAKIAMGVGGTFMFLSGRTKRAPALFRRFGAEWLYRLATQPWRWKRQLALPQFVFLVIRAKIAEKV